MVSASIVSCFRIVAYNNALTITRWVLTSLDNQVLYESGKYSMYETWDFDLGALGLEAGTQFKIKGENSATSDTLNDTILTYIPNYSTIPNPSTVYFENYMKTDTSAALKYNGEIKSYNIPSIISCQKMHINVDTSSGGPSIGLGYSVSVNFQLYTIDGKVISEMYSNGSDDIDVDFNTLDIEPGTLLKLKCSGNYVANLIMENSPDSSYTVNFSCEGGNFPILMYEG